ncbi:uncharacterized protein FOMMEDRAFT_53200, partial [Fomitiporia mediterranea MF3/22]|uniref:uncharacterized protein n=1 Tax=Fomitiporia mediterranea (strain MF3/22) TaxID=694068 RepID=UPI0004408D2F
RLGGQHAHLTEVICGRLIIDKVIQFNPGDRVLDCGVGAGSWILSLSKEVPDSVELVGIDISPSMFPKEVPGNVKLHVVSSMDMPAEWTNTFTLVHQRLLVAAFTAEQWSKDLAEMFRVLKPGGTIQLMEICNYGSLHVPLEKLPATKKVDELIIATLNHKNLLGKACGRALPRMLEETGFSDVQVEDHQLPLGKQWGEIGIRGTRLRDVLLHGFGKTLLAEGGLGLFKSQAEIDEAIGKAKKEWDDTPGVFVYFHCITAKK